jgi:hypothetical protein
MTKINYEGWDDPKFQKRAGKQARKLAETICNLLNKKKIPCTVAAGGLISALAFIVRSAPDDETREYISDFVLGNILHNVGELDHELVQALINNIGDVAMPPPSAERH